MSEEVLDQESAEQDGTDDVVVETRKPPIKKAPAVQAEADEGPTGDTNDAINAPLEGLEDAAVLRGMVTRLRHENGNHRKKNKEVADQAKSLEGWKLAHQKGVAEAEERARVAEAIAHSYVVKAAMQEYDVDEEFYVDIEKHDSEDSIWAAAARLADTKKKKRAYETAPQTAETFAGKRGKPLQRKTDPAGSDFLTDLMRGNF